MSRQLKFLEDAISLLGYLKTVKSFFRLLHKTCITESFCPAISHSHKGTALYLWSPWLFPYPFYTSSHSTIPTTTGLLLLLRAQNTDQDHRHPNHPSLTWATTNHFSKQALLTAALRWDTASSEHTSWHFSGDAVWQKYSWAGWSAETHQSTNMSAWLWESLQHKDFSVD